MKRNRNPHKAKADKLFRQIIIKRDNCCAICGASDKQLHVHHLISRAAVFYRHNIENGIVLCAHCHNFNLKCSPHASPWGFEAWMKANYPDQFAWWAANRYEVVTGQKIDYEAVCETLQDILDGKPGGE